MHPMNAILGFVLLVAGRPLYWAFVGIAGFLLGFHLAGEFLAAQPAWVQVLAAVATGVVGALLAVVAQRIAFAIAGFFAGAWLAALGAESFAAVEGGQLLLLILGGIIGAVVAAILMDWAIIALSSLMGAGLVVIALDLAPEFATAVYVVLVLLGVAIQGGIMRRVRREPPPAPARRST